MNEKDEPAKADCCYGECVGWSEESPCEGPCSVYDEECLPDYSDCWWIHYCEKHAKERGY